MAPNKNKIKKNSIQDNAFNQESLSDQRKTERKLAFESTIAADLSCYFFMSEIKMKDDILAFALKQKLVIKEVTIYIYS